MNESLANTNVGSSSLSGVAYGVSTVVFVPFVGGIVLMMPAVINYDEITKQSGGIYKYAYAPLLIVTAPLFVAGLILSFPGFLLFGSEIS